MLQKSSTENDGFDISLDVSHWGLFLDDESKVRDVRIEDTVPRIESEWLRSKSKSAGKSYNRSAVNYTAVWKGSGWFEKSSWEFWEEIPWMSGK